MRLGPVIRRHRRLTIGAAIVAMLLIVGLGAAVYADHANQYDIKEERIAFQDGAQRLDGVLAKPTNGRGPYGLVILVHGDGPKNATNDGFYRPHMEAYARAGFATLSWNKPGIDGTPGDWLDQSMEDRARPRSPGAGPGRTWTTRGSDCGAPARRAGCCPRSPRGRRT